METRTIKLPDIYVNLLVNLPESGMGYQIVNVILHSGQVLHHHKVLNSELLMLEENEHIRAIDIANIEMETN